MLTSGPLLALPPGAGIMKKHTYGPNDEHFTSSSLLIVFNRIFSVVVGLVILAYKVSAVQVRPWPLAPWAMPRAREQAGAGD